MVIFETDTERNLRALQSSIDDLVSELTAYNGKLLIKAQLFETLSRLIRAKEDLVRRTHRDRALVEKLLSYLMRKGSVDRYTLIRSGFDSEANTAEIDQAIEALKVAGILDVLPAPKKSQTVYKFVEPEDDEIPTSPNINKTSII